MIGFRIVIYVVAIGIVGLACAMAFSLEGASAATKCPNAQSADFLLSSCSGAPGTQLTLTTTLENKPTPTPRNKPKTTATVPKKYNVQLFFRQNRVSGIYSLSAALRSSGAGAYTVTVPQLCGGPNALFGLVISYQLRSTSPAPIQKVKSPVLTQTSANLGDFTVICAPTAAPATASPKPKPTATQRAAGANAAAACPGASAGSAFLFSSCSGAPRTQVTLTGAPPNMASTQLQLLFNFNGVSYQFSTIGYSGGSGGGAAWTFIVPQSVTVRVSGLTVSEPVCSTMVTGGAVNPSVSLVVAYQGNSASSIPEVISVKVGNFTVLCAPTTQATASPKPTPTASPTPTPTASPKPKPTASHHDN